MFNPKYRISDEAAILLSEIGHLTSTLEKVVIPSKVLEHIKQQCMVALTHFSTQIEGNKLSMEQVSGVVEKQRSYGLVRDEKEVKNYFRLLEKIPADLTPELILQCHFDMLEGIVEKELRGKFRKEQNAIYEAGSGKLVYLPPEAKDVEPLIIDLCNWVNKSKAHPIILAAVFHNQFVTIHPFIDGNGRSARLLSLYILETKGYDWKQIVPIDRYYADDRETYYRMLQQSYSHNYYSGRNDTDFTEWIEYYIKGLKCILKGTIEQVELYQSQNILVNNRQSKILKFLEVGKYVTAPQYALKFDISTRMAARDLAQLVEWGKLGVLGKARGTKYFLK